MDVSETALDVLALLGYVGIGLLCGALVSVTLTVVAVLAVRRRPALAPISKRLRVPQRVFLALAGAGIGGLIGTSAAVVDTEPTWRPVAVHVFAILMILAGAWVLAGLVLAAADMILAKQDTESGDERAGRVSTQVQLVGRVAAVLVWVLGIGGALLTFDGFRAVGASIFASAGVLSIIAGLAAQSSLANIFAGLQIAFGDSVRVGDTVIVEGEFGKVEEITLTYVVVRSWDERRLILPSTYFTTTMFENWTRTNREQTGVVLFDLDWLVPVAAMRAQMERIVGASPLWDGREASLQVVETIDGAVRLRIVVSARNPGDLWDLRTHVREELLVWLQTDAPYALPRTRLEPEPTTAPGEDARDSLARDTSALLARERAERPAEPAAVSAPARDDDPVAAALRRVRRRRKGRRPPPAPAAPTAED